MHPLLKSSTPYIPVSWGELIDRITILELKKVRLKSDAARVNAGRELDILLAFSDRQLSSDAGLANLTSRLKAVNGALWESEDRIRDKEAAAQFDDSFIQIARSIYKYNDERTALKNEINVRLASELMEEKNYKDY